VERHGGDLEGDTGQQEHQAEDQAERAFLAGNRRGDLVKPVWPV
jgi:hypothetical protein